MYRACTTFLKFRIRQLGKITREIPVPYLLIIAVLLGSALFAVYKFMANIQGNVIVGAILLLLLIVLHRSRKDYHFMRLVVKQAPLVFCTEYILLSLPVLILGLLQGFYFISIGICLGCIGTGFTKRPFHRTINGLRPPAFIPWEAFEIRAGIRKSGVVIYILYSSAYVGLCIPYVSLALLWFLAVLLIDFFNYSESTSILCSQELSSKQFLHRKLWLNLRLYGIAIAPVCILYTIFYSDSWWLPVVFFIYILINIALILVVKYAFYLPNTKITAGQVAISISLLGTFFPILLPLTLFFIVKNYWAARRNLTDYLYAYN